MIRVDDVRLTLGDVDVLEGVDLRAERGEFVGLVGPNGAGKTTLLRAINGVLDPDSGRVTVDDTRVSAADSRSVSRKVATVPQDGHISFGFTVEQIVEMGRTPHRSRLDWSEGGDPVEHALERTDTAQFRDRPVDELSGGERQRVLLARALAQETPALLLDEPTASLDINHQVRVLGLVEALTAEGRTAVAAIHDLDLAARYCDRLCLLHDGEIRAEGDPRTVLDGASLDEAFETTTAVTTGRATGTPTVAAFEDRPDRDVRVHVVGGGSPGARAVGGLWRAGCTVSVGLVGAGDAAADLADGLGCEAVTAPPFAAPDRQLERARRLAQRADVVVDTGGPGSERMRDPVREHDCVVEADGDSDAVRAVLDRLAEQSVAADD